MLSPLCLRLVVLTAAAAAAAADCPSDQWQQYRDKCYWVSNFTLNGRDMPKVCANMLGGAQPVSIHDLDTDAFIAEDLLKGKLGWLGLYRADTDKPWIWLDGSTVNFTLWHEGEPNLAGEACGAINAFASQAGGWDDTDCDLRYKFFVCQVDF